MLGDKRDELLKNILESRLNKMEINQQLSVKPLEARIFQLE